MGSKLYCEFCGKTSGAFNARIMYRCKSCDAILCSEHIEKEFQFSKFLLMFSPSILFGLFLFYINQFGTSEKIDGETVVTVWIVAQIIAFIVVKVVKKKCLRCGGEKTLLEV